MAQLTRSNIAYDLSISPHRVSIPYGENEPLEFVFSSELYKNKFLEKLNHHREMINLSLTKRFGVAVDLPILSDIKLYTTIEKRGFLLIKNGKVAECLSQVTLGGENPTFKNFAD